LYSFTRQESFIPDHKIFKFHRRIVITMVFFVARDSIIFSRKAFLVTIQNIGNIFSVVHWPLRYYLAKPVTAQLVILDKHEYLYPERTNFICSVSA